jgi:uncharacterized protein
MIKDDMRRKKGIHQEQMRRTALIVLAGGLLLVAFVSVYLSASHAAADVIQGNAIRVHPSVRAKVTIGQRQFTTDVMLTEAEQAHGLSGKPALKESEGMLFVFREASRRVFWMKDMEFAIDMVFIRQNKIVEIAPGMLPPTETGYPETHDSTIASDMVFEVLAGTARLNGWKVGTPIKVDYLPQ